MPLPPALVAKLAKRGLVDSNKTLITKGSLAEFSTDSIKNNDKVEDKVGDEEEVIAEDYDDQNDISDHTLKNDKRIKLSDELSDDLSSDENYKKYKGHFGCPNKVNIYHDCTKFCEDHWKDGKRVPDKKYLRKKAAMLAKYPLPSHWKEIYDPGIGVHYYWEVDSDAVSWLPPSHPRAVITRPAAIDRKNRFKKVLEKENVESDSDELSESEEESNDEEDAVEKQREIKKFKLEVQERTRAKGRTKLKTNNLDPMDPAAYSDIPRGGWGDGLFKGNEAKTGVDVTASGPLYQMRPYPSPGAILKANAEHKKIKTKP
uniref:Polyglutamine-binding protein 1 n=1 Tax=Clastoptera arizonana TaxID=38151 RepID=A0A1B6CRD3_9HEMI